MRRYLTLLLLLIAGCAHVPAGVEQAVEIRVVPDPVELTRADDRTPYEGHIVVEVSARREGVRVRALRLGNDARSPALLYEWNVPVEVTADKPLRKELRVPGTQTGRWMVDVLVETDDASGTVRQVFQVRNSHLEAALAQCRACDGKWGRHGMLGWEGCICRAPDAGERCVDGRDCAGRCLFDHFELIQEGEKPRCDEAGRCRARLAVRRPVGRCSEYEILYGCHAIIRKGAADEPPKPGLVRVPTICID